MGRRGRTSIPGLVFVQRSNGVQAYWRAPPWAMKKGFLPKTVRVWEGASREAMPVEQVRDQCMNLHRELSTWAAQLPKPTPEPAQIKRRSQIGNIYFVKNRDLIKIGFSMNLLRRLASLREEYGPLEVLGILIGPKEMESEVHARFHHCRVDGEWFLPSDDLLDFIRDGCEGADQIADVLRVLRYVQEREPVSLSIRRTK